MVNDQASNVKWFFQPLWLLIALLAAGPFALPLVWLSPRLNKLTKAIITIIMAAMTIWLVKATANIYHDIVKEFAELQSTLQ